MKRSRRFALLLALLALAVPATVHASCSTALLIIDVQELFLTWGDWETSTGGDLLAAVVNALTLARSAGVPVIYIQDFSILDVEAVDEGLLGFPAAIAPREGDPVFPKDQADAFTTPEFGEYLEEQGIRRLLLCGLASGGCVQATLFSAITKGYDATVVANAHSNGPPDPVTGAPRWPAVEANRYWISRGVSVVSMGEIDWNSFGCSATAD